MVDTNSNTYGMDLTKLPKNTQQNTSSFKNWCNTIGKELDQNTSEHRISLLGYIINVNKATVNYGDAEQKLCD